MHSGQLTLSAGYRWGWIGLYVDQTIAAGQSFLAFSTTIGTKYFYKCTDNLELWGQTSIGGVFIFIFPHLAVKLATGLSYKVTDIMMIGADLTYLLGFLPYGGTDGISHSPSVSFHLRFLL